MFGASRIEELEPTRRVRLRAEDSLLRHFVNIRNDHSYLTIETPPKIMGDKAEMSRISLATAILLGCSRVRTPVGGHGWV